MKTFIMPVLILLSFFASASNSHSQIQFFDSVKTVVSSSTYSYKNPVFSNSSVSFFNPYSWLVYERHDGSSSEIVCRKARYDSYDRELVISGTANALNINPAIDYSSLGHGMIVWQSNVSGNWDLYYSTLINDSTWSSPLIAVNSPGDDTNPYVYNNNTDPYQFNYFYLAYKAGNSIRFKRYKTSAGIWDNDTLITDAVYNDINPVIAKGNTASQYGLVFQRKLSGTYSRLNQRLFYESTSAVSWNNLTEIYQPNSQNNLSKAFSTSVFLTYSYDTLNSTHILGFQLNGQNDKIVVTQNVPGKHIAGKGSVMGIITDAVPFYFSAFSALSKHSDSLCFTFINRPASFNEFPQYKKIYLGDTNTVTRFDVSQPIFQQSLHYRIKTVWEKTTGGKTELVESYMTDHLNEISNNSSNVEGFYLEQNYPNPFNPVTNLGFGISNLGFVSLKIYDALGKEVKILVNEIKPAGIYEVEFDGSDLPSGIYFYELKSGDYSVSKRMILLK